MKTRIFLFLLCISPWAVYGQKPVADLEIRIHYGRWMARNEYKNLSENADTFLWDRGHTGDFVQIYELRGYRTGANKTVSAWSAKRLKFVVWKELCG